jgi:hypothetical protein
VPCERKGGRWERGGDGGEKDVTWPLILLIFRASPFCSSSLPVCRFGRHWWWMSFFAAYISQHFMLMGITWPLLSIHTVNLPWHPVWDTLALAICVTGGCEAGDG